ncbi:MAG: N-6 DNA methylase [Ruminococcus sp.]|uniref:type ISP restriction/modification enzyme n=1 Tax=Ruminococcus sp. TaxID=41978 RepID=UPI0025CEB6BE|nr:type ISP restriction/modification enzyme [Ruminococcus sp.]MBO4867253.1 N-6 DNA methylase [Ruminococcus sp.]
MDIRNIKSIDDLIIYFTEELNWNIDLDDFDEIDDITYDFDAADIGLKEEAFAKITSLRQLQPLCDEQKWGIFCVEFDSNKFEVSALRKILSGLIPKRRNTADHAVWAQKDLLFLCFWGTDNNRTIGIAHFEDKDTGLPQIKMISCAPAVEDFTQIRIFEERIGHLSWVKDVANTQAWYEQWSSAFVTAYHQVIRDSASLTVKLAAEAQAIRDRILDIYAVETHDGYVHKLFKDFKDNLIHDMTKQQFADMYAQTVVYGLFSARCMDKTQGDFDVQEAIKCIPNTNPFLKRLMEECLGESSERHLTFDELEVANVVEILTHTNTDLILADFNRQTGGGREDPVIHFYEEFLTAYDKAQKVQRGVYYTPQPVVNFIVRAVDSILKTEFGLVDGLASEDKKSILVDIEGKKRRERWEVPAVQILDPTTGTGTFLRQTILQIYDHFKIKHKGESKESITKAWNLYVDNNLLPRLNGFELMMAPYAVAHMKLAMVLKDTGYNFSGDHRLNVFLTNSLEEAGKDDMQLSLFGDDPLAFESAEANQAKKNTGINVIIGNPPYSGESANKGKWITDLIEDYKKEPGGKEKLQEQNSKWINDDYVKFIRLSQLYLHRTEQGILSFICPHGFIDNPTFRGMRWNLAKTYKKIYILDLHGNTKKRETCPDGSKDENVFDIQQGVCIMFMIYQNANSSNFAEIYHADLFGSREIKYNTLNELFFTDVKWRKVKSTAPFFLFKPTKEITEKSERFNVSEIFITSTMGFQTHRDILAISFTEETMQGRIEDILTCSDIEALKTKYAIKDTSEWSIIKAKEQLKVLDEAYISEKTTKCQYRLFDIRYCFLDGIFMDRPRLNVFCHVANKDNYVLGIGRQGLAVGDIEWCLATVSHYAMDANIFRRGGVTAAPLYLYGNTINNTKRTPNLKGTFVDKFAKCLELKFAEEKTNNKEEFAPIDIIDYIYAILYSHKYREVFSDELKIDYPKIPYPTSAEYFWSLVAKGKELREIHTMDKVLSTNTISFSGENGCLVERYKLIDNKVYINKNHFFTTEESLSSVWEYTIGGNQPLQKWLKDRKGMTLSTDDIEHYKQIIAALRRTEELMAEIDQVVEF